MANELVSQADAAFEQGDFEESSRLYIEALSQAEQNGGGEVVEILQKLGDSDYAASRYEEARRSYERLVQLHGDGKNKVNALLKLAKCSDKCADADAARLQFKLAYDMCRSALSEKHYLRRTVLGAYADWLRSAGDNAQLLRSVEDELGVEQQPAAGEANKNEEVTAQSITVPSAAPVEREFFVLKTKLTKFKKVKPSDSGEGSDSGEDAFKAKKIEAQKQSLDQQVAERKFLRKAAAVDDTDSRTNRRAKLRGALSDPSRPSKRGQSDEVVAGAEASALTNAEETSAADMSVSGQYAHLTGEAFPSSEPNREKTQQEAIFEAQLNPAGADQHSLSKISGMKPRRHFSDRLEIADRVKHGVNLVVPAQGEGLDKSSRSFLQHSEAVKKSEPAAEPSADLEQLRTSDFPGYSPQFIFWQGFRVIAPLAAMALLIAASYFLYTSTVKQNSSTEVPYFEAPMINKEFDTADDAIKLSLTAHYVQMRTAKKTTMVPLRIWHDDWLDELALMFGQLKQYQWIYIVPDGLSDQNGIFFFGEHSPERRVIDFSKSVAKQAAQYFAEKSDYPNYAADISDAAYKNPFTKQPDVVAICSGVDPRTAADRDSQLDLDLKAGGLFKAESALHPGAVHALSVIGHPLPGNEEGTYNWAVRCFYIHACDANGNLIAGSTPGQVFLITMKNGYTVPSEVDPSYGMGGFCLSQSASPNINFVTFKWVGGFFGVLILVAYLSRSRIRRK